MSSVSNAAASAAGLELVRKRWAAGTPDRTAKRAQDIVRDWPILGERQRAVIREILAPVVTSGEDAEGAST